MSAQERKYLFTAAWMMLISLTQPISAQQRNPAPIAKAQRRLLQLVAPDSVTSGVPASIKSSIANFKRVLADQTDAVITRLPSNLTAASVKQRISAAMPSPRVGKISDEQWRKINDEDLNKPLAGLYGGELTLSVSQPKPSLLLIKETFDIACGTDNVLLGYSNADGMWKRILLWQSDPYDEISGAFGDTYETLLLKPEHNHHPLLLVVHGTPWCTSTMSAFTMDILELKGGTETTTLWHRDHGYRRADVDPPFTLRLTTDGFEVRTIVNTSGDKISRKGVMRYSVLPAGIHRVEPLAMNGRDSIEEWLEMPREDAAEFVDHPEASLTWQMFQDFTYEGKDKDAMGPYPKFGAVRLCKDSASHFQAEVTSEIFDRSKTGSHPGPAYFVQLQEVPNGYRIHSASHKPDGSCTGPDLMAGS
jgi:hypothetical protein